MKRPIAVIVVAALAASAMRALAADSCAAPCPKVPKNNRSVSAVGAPLLVFPAGTLTATLAKGKSKRILDVQASLSDAPVAPAALPYQLALGVAVNGLLMQPGTAPGSADFVEDCGPFRTDGDFDLYCHVSGHWWADLDDATYAALIGVPITVTLYYGDVAGIMPPLPVAVSLSVELKKK